MVKQPQPDTTLNRGVLILGTDTEVGKTYQACNLLRALVNRGVSTGAYKPLASGLPIDSPAGDPFLLRMAAGLSCDLTQICPQSFTSPLAPPVAARTEGRQIDWHEVLDGAKTWRDRCDFLVCESAGGVMSPLSDQHTSIDLALALRLPVILVAANRLGCVNHCLLSLHALASHEIPVHSIVLNTLPDRAPRETRDISLVSNRQLLAQFTKIPILDSADQSLYLPASR